MEYPENLFYSKDHEWVEKQDERTALVGITDYAQDALGDIVFCDLKAPGTEIEKGEPLGELESVKSVSDVISPLSGKIVEINEEAGENPELINEDPYGRGWLAVVEFEDEAEISELMDSEQYEGYVEGEEEG